MLGGRDGTTTSRRVSDRRTRAGQPPYSGNIGEAQAQGRGVGKALLAEACEAAQQTGLKRVTLTTCRDVPWNAPFYHKIGFEYLEEPALDPDLRATLKEEEACGFLPGTRCAMQRCL
ncbi:putative acetyltransferase [Acetobacter malorum]|uniref:Putative acetyltransferase n=1 Tax=Acetobacter malorum TaxID=178901 RepID=A0A177G6V4_9PROT|nr:putative acetyltransferase [Acetobacter malorum]